MFCFENHPREDEGAKAQSRRFSRIGKNHTADPTLLKVGGSSELISAVAALDRRMYHLECESYYCGWSSVNAGGKIMPIPRKPPPTYIRREWRALGRGRHLNSGRKTQIDFYKSARAQDGSRGRVKNVDFEKRADGGSRHMHVIRVSDCFQSKTPSSRKSYLCTAPPYGGDEKCESSRTRRIRDSPQPAKKICGRRTMDQTS